MPKKRKRASIIDLDEMLAAVDEEMYISSSFPYTKQTSTSPDAEPVPATKQEIKEAAQEVKILQLFKRILLSAKSQRSRPRLNTTEEKILWTISHVHPTPIIAADICQRIGIANRETVAKYLGPESKLRVFYGIHLCKSGYYRGRAINV